MEWILLAGGFWDDMRLAVSMLFFVWILNWSKAHLGSTRLAVLYAIILTYITFWKWPELTYLFIFAIIVATFGKKFTEQIMPGGGGGGEMVPTFKLVIDRK